MKRHNEKRQLKEKEKGTTSDLLSPTSLKSQESPKSRLFWPEQIIFNVDI
jgi:hypothetical protein